MYLPDDKDLDLFLQSLEPRLLKLIEEIANRPEEETKNVASMPKIHKFQVKLFLSVNTFI